MNPEQFAELMELLKTIAKTLAVLTTATIFTIVSIVVCALYWRIKLMSGRPATTIQEPVAVAAAAAAKPPDLFFEAVMRMKEAGESLAPSAVRERVAVQKAMRNLQAGPLHWEQAVTDLRALLPPIPTTPWRAVEFLLDPIPTPVRVNRAINAIQALIDDLSDRSLTTNKP